MLSNKRFNLLDIKINYCIIDKGFRKQKLNISFANGNSIRISLGINNIFKVLSAEPMKTNNRKKISITSSNCQTCKNNFSLWVHRCFRLIIAQAEQKIYIFALLEILPQIEFEYSKEYPLSGCETQTKMEIQCCEIYLGINIVNMTTDMNVVKP